VSDVPRLLLASQSPARLKLLAAAGIDAEVMVSGVDESTVSSSNAELLSLTLGRMKAEAIASKLGASERASEHLLILGCDSVLEFDGQVLGKPDDAADATRRWQRMRGRTGVLHTGHCLIELRSGKHAEGAAATAVTFADVSDDEIAAYVASGEPLHVAGAFTIDGLGSPFIERLDGDHTTVVGLSMSMLRNLLAALGVGITDLWRINALT
jgi:nucleoside triphosphate pyrophosphatase